MKIKQSDFPHYFASSFRFISCSLSTRSESRLRPEVTLRRSAPPAP